MFHPPMVLNIASYTQWCTTQRTHPRSALAFTRLERSGTIGAHVRLDVRPSLSFLGLIGQVCTRARGTLQRLSSLACRPLVWVHVDLALTVTVF